MIRDLKYLRYITRDINIFGRQGLYIRKDIRFFLAKSKILGKWYRMLYTFNSDKGIEYTVVRIEKLPITWPYY